MGIKWVGVLMLGSFTFGVFATMLLQTTPGVRTGSPNAGANSPWISCVIGNSRKPDGRRDGELTVTVPSASDVARKSVLEIRELDVRGQLVGQPLSKISAHVKTMTRLTVFNHFVMITWNGGDAERPDFTCQISVDLETWEIKRADFVPPKL
jgi:hypothetical protein